MDKVTRQLMCDKAVNGPRLICGLAVCFTVVKKKNQHCYEVVKKKKKKRRDFYTSKHDRVYDEG